MSILNSWYLQMAEWWERPCKCRMHFSGVSIDLKPRGQITCGHRKILIAGSAVEVPGAVHVWVSTEKTDGDNRD